MLSKGAAATAENMVFSGVILRWKFHVLPFHSHAHINILLCSNKMCGMSTDIKKKRKKEIFFFIHDAIFVSIYSIKT